MALFQQNAGSSGSTSKNFVEFKCGKMSRNGTTVTADTRKGMDAVFTELLYEIFVRRASYHFKA